MADVGNIIRKKRLGKGVKQKDLAKMADISSSSLCDIEKGRSNPSIKTLAKIARALNEPLSNFLPEKQNEESYYQIINEEIEGLKKELNSLYNQSDNLQAEKVLQISRKLDELIKKLYT